MSHFARLLGVSLCVVAIFGCGKVQKPNRPLPVEFRAVTLTSDVIDRGELLGRPWVITVWRPNCALCLKQLTQMEALKASLGNGPVGFLALSLDDDEDRVIEAAGRLELNATIAIARSDTMGPLGLSQLPGCAFLNADGTIVAAASGEQSDSTLAKWAGVISSAEP